MKRRALAATLVLACALAGCERVEPERPERPEESARTEQAAGETPAASRPAGVAAATLSPRDSLRASLGRLVAGGPNPRTGAAPTWFSQGTAGVLRAVEIDSTGRALVDFHDLRAIIPGASSSAGSRALLDDLNAAVFDVPAIRSVEYRMEGSCTLFGEWLQYGTCMTFSREEQDVR